MKGVATTKMDKSNSQGAGNSASGSAGSFLRHQQEFASLIYFERESFWKYI